MPKLKQIREKRFITQAELAEMIGVAPHSISRWENGKQKPMFKSIRKLAKALKVNPEDIEF